MTNGYRKPDDAAALAHNFRVFAEVDCASEPLYAALSIGIADRPSLLALLMLAPYSQRRPVLLFAVTHDLLLAGADHPLARFHRSVVGDGGLRTDVDRAIDAFDDFCAAHRDAITTSLAERATQTNEVGRGCGLWLALSTLSPDRPVALIDVGCSAGLNLLVDRYRFEFRGPGDASTDEGPDSAVVVRTTVSGDAPFGHGPRAIPAIARRVGIDLVPLDVRDERDARWLQACVWPSEKIRHARLAAAIAIARNTPLDLRRGDANERLAEVLAAIEAGLRPVVFHSWVVSYFDGPSRRRFVDTIRAMVLEHDGAWISAEAPGVIPGLEPLPLAADATPAMREATLWHVTTREGVRAIARSHPHGRWIEWHGADAWASAADGPGSNQRGR